MGADRTVGRCSLGAGVIGGAMQAVTFSATIAGYLFARTAGRFRRGAPYGPFGSLRLADVPEPEVPGPDWVALEVIGSGVCGSDVSVVGYTFTLSLEPFVSFPAVLGHEILARVVEVGSAVSGLEPGQRVAVDPMLSCAVRGHLDICAECANGRPASCRRSGDPGVTMIGGRPLQRGMSLGYHADLPGGFCSRIIAHRSQLHPVPDTLDDMAAVLTEPLSVAAHGVLQTAADAREPVLVIGSGIVALGVVWALRRVGFEGEIVAQVKRDHEAELARSLGANAAVRPGGEAVDALLATGASPYKPMLGSRVYAGGGFPLVFDCVGSRASLNQATGFAAPGGRIAVLGCSAVVPKLDLSFLWSRELQMLGFCGYGTEKWQGRTLHTYEVALGWMDENPSILTDLVTHRLPLEEYRAAFRIAADHRRSRSMKVVMGSVA